MYQYAVRDFFETGETAVINIYLIQIFFTQQIHYQRQHVKLLSATSVSHCEGILQCSHHALVDQDHRLASR